MTKKEVNDKYYQTALNFCRDDKDRYIVKSIASGANASEAARQLGLSSGRGRERWRSIKGRMEKGALDATTQNAKVVEEQIPVEEEHRLKTKTKQMTKDLAEANKEIAELRNTLSLLTDIPKSDITPAKIKHRKASKHKVAVTSFLSEPNTCLLYTSDAADE